MEINLKNIDNDIHSFLPNKNSMDYVDKLVVGLKTDLDFLTEKATDRIRKKFISK